MLYKFKSKASGDVLMTQSPAHDLLRAIGKDTGESGIVLPEQMQEVLAKIESACMGDDAQRKATKAKGLPVDAVSFRQRTRPFVTLLQRSLAEEAPVTWGA